MFGTVWLTSEEWTDLFGEEAQKNELISSGAEERGQICFFPRGLHDMEDRETESVFEQRVCGLLIRIWCLIGGCVAGLTQRHISESLKRAMQHCPKCTVCERDWEKMNVSAIIIHSVTDNNRCFIEMLFWLFRCLTGHCENISPDTHSEIMWLLRQTPNQSSFPSQCLSVTAKLGCRVC